MIYSLLANEVFEFSFPDLVAVASLDWTKVSESGDQYKNFIHGPTFFYSLPFVLINVVMYKLGMPEQF